MISFAYPEMLYLLLLIPALAGLFVLARYARRRNLERFGRLSVITPLMPEASPYKPWIKLTLRLLALAFIIIALARPRSNAAIGSVTEEQTVRGMEVMVCLDVSNSMLASSTDDPSGISRLQRAKFILEKLIDKMSDDKVGLIVFAGDAYTQLPITSDYISAKMFLSSINTDIVPTQGTAIGAAIEMAMNSFTPTDQFQKAIVVITDAENFEDDAVGTAKRASDAGIQVDVIGVGSGKPNPIPINASRTEFMRDHNGEEVMTALNVKLAEDIANAGKGIYLSGSNSSVANELDDELSKFAKTEYLRTSVPTAAEQFPVAVWIALILIIIDIFVLDRKISWLKNINFFSDSSKKGTAKVDQEK